MKIQFKISINELDRVSLEFSRLFTFISSIAIIWPIIILFYVILGIWLHGFCRV